MSEVSFSSSYRARDEDHDNRINYGYDRMNQDFHIGSSFSNQGYRGQRHYRRGGRHHQNNYGGRGRGYTRDYQDYADGKRKYSDINTEEAPITSLTAEMLERGLEAERPSFGAQIGRGGRSYGRGRGARKPGGMVEYKEEPLHPSVKMAKDIITRLGDYSNMSEDDDLIMNIKSLSQVLIGSGDLREHSAAMSDLFLACLTSLSVQIPILTTLVALIHKHDREFSSLVVDRVCQRILVALGEGDIVLAKVGIRSLACLTSAQCVQPFGEGGFSALLEALMDIAYGSWTNQANATATLSIEGQIVTFLIASTLPWIAQLYSMTSEGLTILSRAEPLCARVISDWKSPFYVGGKQALFHAVIEDDVMTEKLSLSDAEANATVWDTLIDSCKLGIEIISKARSNSYIPPPCMNCCWLQPILADELKADESSQYSPLSTDFRSIIQTFLEPSATDSGMTEARLRNHPKPNSPGAQVEGSSTSQWLRPNFVVFDSEISPQVSSLCANLSRLERLTLKFYYLDILHFFEPQIRENGTKIGSVNLVCDHLVAVNKLSASNEAVEYILIEALFQLLMQLPEDSIMLGYVGKVILELCRRIPTIPQILALGTSILFQQLTDLDTSAWRSLGKWLSFHLVNTKLSWPYWNFWAEEFENSSSNSTTRGFCALVVERCSHVTVVKTLKEALPPQLQALVQNEFDFRCELCEGIAPTAAENADAIMTSDDAGEVEGNMKAGNTLPAIVTLYKLVETKVEADEVEGWLESNEAEELEKESSVPHFRLKVLLQVIFHLSQRTPSGLGGLLDRYLEPLRMYADTPEAEKAVVVFVIEMLAGNSNLTAFVFDMLLRRAIISATAVLNWAMDDSNLNPFVNYLVSQPWVYHLIETAVDRCLDSMKASLQYRKQFESEASSHSRRSIRRLNPVGRGEEDEDDQMLEATNTLEEDEDSPIALATEALKLSQSNCQQVYSTVIGSSLRGIITISVRGTDDDDEWVTVALSLMLRTLRAYHGLQYHFQKTTVGTILELTDIVGPAAGQVIKIKHEALNAVNQNLTGKSMAAISVLQSFGCC